MLPLSRPLCKQHDRTRSVARVRSKRQPEQPKEPMPSALPQNLTRIFARTLVIGGLVVGLAACGGNDDVGLGDLIDVAQSAEISDDGSFSANVGGGEVQFGADERPDWLPAWFVLPEGLNVQYAINVPDTGERAIAGWIEGGTEADAEAIEAQAVAMMQANGYERLGDSTIFLRDGEPATEISATSNGESVYYEYKFRFEDETTLRDAYSPIEGTGTLAAVIGDEEFSFTGECSVRSNSGYFEAAEDTGTTVSFNVEVRDGQQDYLLISLLSVDGATLANWNIVQEGNSSGIDPTAAVSGNQVNVTGLFRDFEGGEATGTMTLTCG